jgi:putative flavoprotein involved in K+ transport
MTPVPPTPEPSRQVSAVVVGAGPAGLAVSRHLTMLGVEHVVLERDVVGATWRAQRWDGFTLVTPLWAVRLPGLLTAEAEADNFLSRAEFVQLLESYASQTHAPVRTGVEVSGLRADDGGYVLTTSEGDWSARAVVVASGAQRRPRIPDGISLPPGVTAIHAVDYRRPSQLASGAVLVVGSGQTGTQLADELRRAGRRVFLATSSVGRVPRRYRGQDVFHWLRDTGRLDESADQVPAEVRRARQPAVSGVGGGRTMALQQLARDGIVLLGRLTGVERGRFLFADDLAGNVGAADAFAARFRAQVDGYVGSQPAGVPDPDTDPAERPLDAVPAAPAELDAATENISTVLWCTGMGPDMAWLPENLLDRAGVPRHDHGAMELPGLYVVGIPWLTHRGSGILYGMATDAARVTERVRDDLARSSSPVHPGGLRM